MKNIFLLLIIVFIGILACKKTPTFSVENELDSLNDFFKPDTVSNASMEISGNEIHLLWNINSTQSEAISGFKVSRSYTDTSSFALIQIVNSKVNTFSYSIKSPSNLLTFKYIYKIESFLEINKDTVFSTPIYLQKDVAPYHSVNAELYPFYSIPLISIAWDFEKSSGISIEYFEGNQDVKTFLGSTDNEGNSTKKSFGINLQDTIYKYFYRLNRNNFISDYREIDFYFESPTWLLDVSQNSSNDTLVITLEIIESDELEPQLLNRYSNKKSMNQNFTFDEIDIQLTFFYPDSSSTLVEKVITDPNQEEVVNFSTLSDSDLIQINVRGIKGIYNTEITQKRVPINPITKFKNK